MFSFILIAGTLAAAAAAVLLVPLIRQRADAKPASTTTAVVVSFGMLMGGATLYAAFSNYNWNESASTADTPAAMTARLAKRLASAPDDLPGWLMLGRSYAELGQYPLAARAFERADQLAQGKSVEALLGLGETLVAQNTENIQGVAGRKFEQALALDPTSGKALFYSAFAASARGERALARQRFQHMLAAGPPPEVRAIIEKQIAALDLPDSTTQAGGEAPTADAQARVSVRVSVAPALAAGIPGGASLFVIARDPGAPGPPLAVKRLPATFPVDVELSAADAMLAERHITAGQQLEVVARVSLGGAPTATSGDPFGQVGYHVGRDGRLNIVIDKLAP